MIPTRSVIGQVLDLTAVAGQSGTVEFYPVVYRRGAPFTISGITDNTTDDFLTGFRSVSYDASVNNGEFSVDLPVTDSLNSSPTNFSWWAVVKNLSGSKLWQFYFNLPEDEFGPLDLSNAVPAEEGSDTSDNGNATRGSDGVLVRNGIRMSDVWVRSSGDPIPDNLPPNTLVVTV